MKTRLTIIALGALAMLAGCGRSEVAPDVTTFNLSVRAESDATRATVNDGGNFAWTSGVMVLSSCFYAAGQSAHISEAILSLLCANVNNAPVLIDRIPRLL